MLTSHIKISWGHEMASGETCQTCSAGCWHVCSPLTWGTPHLQHLLMLRILSSYWSKFLQSQIPLLSVFAIFGSVIPLGMPAGHSGADVAVGRWREHWVPNEVRSQEARLESSGMSIPEVQTNNSITLPLPALLRVDKQQAFIKGWALTLLPNPMPT